MKPGETERSPHELTLRSWLGRLRQRWQLVTRLGVSARAAAAVAGVGLAAWLVDRLAEPAGPALVLLYAAAAALLAAVLIVLARPLRVRPSDRQLARLAEERDGSLDEVVVTATERLDAGQPGPLDGLVVRSAADRIRQIEPTVVIEPAVVSRAARWAIASLAVLAISLTVAWAPAWRALQTARLYIAPPDVALVVEPGDARVLAGSPLKIVARFEGLPAGATPDVPSVALVEGGTASTLSMRKEGDRYVGEVPRVDRALRYRVVSGTVTSREFQVAALQAARVRRIDLEYEFPAFTKLPARTEEDGGDIYGPAGTRVRLRVHTDKPVTGGALALREGAPVPLEQIGASTELAATLTLDRDGAYRVGLVDVDGLTSPAGTEYFIRVMDDRPPDVRLLRPAGDRQVTRLEEIAIEARADDDHGVSALELVYAVKGGKEVVVPLHRARAGASTSVTGAHTMYVEELAVEPGDFITYYARARDVSRGKRSTEVRSDIFFLEVRPFTEEFFAAQSQAMMGGGGGQAADLLEAQKEIIVATWKLQRRAIAGQSAEDVRAVGKAQGELRKRAEQMAAQMTRLSMPSRRRGGAPQPAPPPQTDDNPLTRAASAMKRAEQSLNGLKPSDAVPHEMTAYNELLKLQAENTRREVARQRGGGGRGGRTGNQDLSALFDEELLRQQDTNYENRNAAGGQQGQDQQDPALEKLKELARRQDELAQRQRDLARARASMKQDEVKRQLERLTREQEELRRETEALSQQMARGQRDGQRGQQQGQSSQGQSAQGQSAQGQSAQGQSEQGEDSAQGSRAQGGGQAAGSRDLQEAAEQMADAARELSEADLDAARDRTEETLNRLRELERRLSGEAVPDEGRRRFGELQLEAQQVAEAQRRLAGESRRLQPSGQSRGGNAAGQGSAGAAPNDAMRRLAADQERLAERVDALERRLKSVTDARGGEEAAKAAGAARDELARARLADQMRATADAMRQAGSGDRPSDRAGQNPGAGDRAPADRAEAAAQAASRVAERLGSSIAGSPEAREMASQLAQLRDLRERLGEIETRLREAVQRGQAQQGADRRGGPGAQNGQNGQARGSQNPRSGQQGQGQSAEGQSASGESGGREAGGRQGGGGGNGDGSSEIQRLQAEYDAALRQTRSLIDAIGRQQGQGEGRQAGAMATPEGHEFSRSAPGTEAFKQDYARWDSLTKDVNTALEQAEASLAQRLSERAAKDRVHAGGDEKAPEQYADTVSRYYRSLARRPPQP